MEGAAKFSLCLCLSVCLSLSTSPSLPHIPPPSLSLSWPDSAPLELAHSWVRASEDNEQNHATRNEAPVVFLHGLYGSQMNFRTIARHVAQNLDRPVVLMDMRNHGKTAHTESMTYEEMAEDVAHTLTNTLGITKASLVGHSMGGKIAMMAALLHPNLVRDMVVVDIAPVSYPPLRDTMRVAQAMKQVPMHSGAIKTRQDADAALKHEVRDPMVRKFVLTNFVPGKSSTTHNHNNHNKNQQNQQQNAGTDPSWRVNIDSILKHLPVISSFPLLPGDMVNPACRTLFLYGSKSNYVLDTHSEVIASFFPDYEMKSLDAGHWVHAERQPEFIDAVTHFLAQTR